MITDYLTHRGYIGSINISLSDDVLYGKLMFIEDLIIYEARTIPDIKLNFINTIDDYLKSCQLLGRKPNKTTNGFLHLNINNTLYNRLIKAANKNNICVNDYIKKAIELNVSNDTNDVLTKII